MQTVFKPCKLERDVRPSPESEEPTKEKTLEDPEAVEAEQLSVNVAKRDALEEEPDYEYEYEEPNREESQSEKRQADAQDPDKGEVAEAEEEEQSSQRELGRHQASC